MTLRYRYYNNYSKNKKKQKSTTVLVTVSTNIINDGRSRRALKGFLYEVCRNLKLSFYCTLAFRLSFLIKIFVIYTI